MTADHLRIANLFGLDINNAQHSLAIVDAMQGISDTAEFIEYCRSRKGGIEYATKTEKLDTLSHKYKQKQIDSQLEQKYQNGDAYSKRIAEKVKACRNFVEEAGCKFSEVWKDGERLFEDHEIRALKEVGSPTVVIELSRRHTLAAKISELYADKVRGQASAKIGYKGGERKVLNMAKNISRNM